MVCKCSSQTDCQEGSSVGETRGALGFTLELSVSLSMTENDQLQLVRMGRGRRYHSY